MLLRTTVAGRGLRAGNLRWSYGLLERRHQQVPVAREDWQRRFPGRHAPREGVCCVSMFWVCLRPMIRVCAWVHFFSCRCEIRGRYGFVHDMFLCFCVRTGCWFGFGHESTRLMFRRYECPQYENCFCVSSDFGGARFGLAAVSTRFLSVSVRFYV